MPYRISLVLLTILMFSAPQAFAADIQGPRIYVAEPRHDLGMVKEGDMPEHAFEIRNVGDEPLIIQRVQPS